MRSYEDRIHAQTDEFVAALQDLHAAGHEQVYMMDICRQMAANDEAIMRRHRVASKIMGLLGITKAEPLKMPGMLYPVAARLNREGRLESDWEAAALETSSHPRRRLYRLVEEPLSQS